MARRAKSRKSGRNSVAARGRKSASKSKRTVSRKSSKKPVRRVARKNSRKSSRNSVSKRGRKVRRSSRTNSRVSRKNISTAVKSVHNTNEKLHKLKQLIASRVNEMKQKQDQHFGNTRVRILRNSDFDHGNLARENSGRSGLIMFYAPWCPHCTNMIPTLNNLADDMSRDNELSSRGLLGAVDCTENREIAERMGVMGYPTIKIFKNGRYMGDYEGSRDSNELRNFIVRLLHE